MTMRYFQQTVHGFQEGGFSGSVRATDHDKFSLVYFERKVADTGAWSPSYAVYIPEREMRGCIVSGCIRYPFLHRKTGLFDFPEKTDRVVFDCALVVIAPGWGCYWSRGIESTLPFEINSHRIGFPSIISMFLFPSVQPLPSCIPSTMHDSGGCRSSRPWPSWRTVIAEIITGIPADAIANHDVRTKMAVKGCKVLRGVFMYKMGNLQPE